MTFATTLAHVFPTCTNARHNFVSLIELRKAMPMPKATFDAELRKLRIAGLYTCSTDDGRFGMTQEMRESAIEECGELLMYVSIRN